MEMYPSDETSQSRNSIISSSKSITMFYGYAIYKGINDVWHISFSIEGLPYGENVRSVEITKDEAALLIEKYNLTDHTGQGWYC